MGETFARLPKTSSDQTALSMSSNPRRIVQQTNMALPHEKAKPGRCQRAQLIAVRHCAAQARQVMRAEHAGGFCSYQDL
jgi:4'-phosphopantetheinyl transferase EntD